MPATPQVVVHGLGAHLGVVKVVPTVTVGVLAALGGAGEGGAGPAGGGVGVAQNRVWGHFLSQSWTMLDKVLCITGDSAFAKTR